MKVRNLKNNKNQKGLALLIPWDELDRLKARGICADQYPPVHGRAHMCDLSWPQAHPWKV